jgi:hypothetical protein
MAQLNFFFDFKFDLVFIVAEHAEEDTLFKKSSEGEKILEIIPSDYLEEDLVLRYTPAKHEPLFQYSTCSTSSI